MKKKIIIGILAIVVIVLGITALKQGDNVNNTDVVKVGVILPLSGQYAVFGESVRNAITMSFNDLENKNIQLIFEDDEFDSKKGLSAYNKLQNVDNVDIIVALSSPVLEVLKPIVNQSDELMLTVGNESSIENDNVFEIIPWGAKLFTILGEEVSETYDNIAIVYSSEASIFETNKGLFVDGLKNQNYIEVAVSSNSDVRTEVSKMLAQNVDAYTLFLTVDQGVKFLNEVARQGGANRPQLICDANIELTIGDYLGKVIDKNIFENCISTMIADTTNKEFNEKYKELYEYDPNFIAVYGYDAVQIISKKLAGKNKADWKKILDDNKFEHMGMSGKIIFDETGSRVLESVVNIFKSGAFVKLEN
jgi:branched-chain amino acid transport system substrate-binding protein